VLLLTTDGLLKEDMIKLELMNSLKKQFLGLALVLIFASVGVSQPGWNWGDSVDKAKEKNALYTDLVRAENWKGAISPHSWLLKNTPDLNAAIYINGAKIYEGLADATEDKQLTLDYQGKALEMYDLRIKYFGDEADVLNRKAYVAYKYYRDDQPKYKELYELFTRAFDLNGANVMVNNLTAYMDVIRRYKLVGGAITDDVVFKKYTLIKDIIDQQLANGGKESTLNKQSDYIDKMLTATVQVDCQFIEEKLGPKFRATKDISLAKKIFSLMVTQKCTDSPLAMETAIEVNNVSPDYGIAKFIASRAGSDGDMSKAIEYYDKAIKLTTDNTKKAEVYLSIARIQVAQGDKAAARSSARKALAFDPSNTEPYSFIGDLYMNSGTECKGGQSKVKDRAVYIAAYEMYQKAGDSSKMSGAKAQFPSIEDIFSEGKEEGGSITVDCWINETVKIQRRPAN
jgi:tetratricopeptide (TPR) repeat protein